MAILGMMMVIMLIHDGDDIVGVDADDQTNHDGEDDHDIDGL